MELYRELANDFIDMRREYSYVKFDKEISRKIKNDIFVLSYLKRHNGYAHPKDLSEEFIISTAQMAVILNHLEERKLIVRLHDPESNRQTIVQLTQEGSEFFDSVNGEIIDFTARLFHEIGPQDSREFIRIIRRMMVAIAAEAEAKIENHLSISMHAPTENSCKKGVNK